MVPANTRGRSRPAEGGDGGPRPRLVRLDRDTPEAAALRVAVLRHRLAPGQRRFVGEAVHTLPRADGDPARTPYAIAVGDAPLTDATEARLSCAGFGVLDRTGHLRALVDSPERAVLLRAYYVTTEWQGHGVGRASCSAPLLDCLVAEVAPGATEIVLCADEGNDTAQYVYQAAGFTFTGRRHAAESGVTELVMSRPLDTEHPEPRPRHERTENSQ